ncbi:hypothetical protein ACF0H5_017317 [Mactra antiquata]
MMMASPAMSVKGVEDSEEFDEACKPVTLYCEPLTVEEFEDQSERETQKALNNLMVYLDSHKDEFTDMLKKKKRQELETGGILSLMKVKVYDIIHGENSPLVRVTEPERDQHLQDLKTNMKKAFDVNLETKGRRTSKRLESKRLRQGQDPNATPKRVTSAPATKKRTNGVPAPPPPPPPPVPPLVENVTPIKISGLTRKPLTPIENRLNKVTGQLKDTKKRDSMDPDDILGSTPHLDCSLTSLHQELLSSNPWKRLKCVSENRDPNETPVKFAVPTEPLHRALLNKFKNVRAPSPADSPNNTITSPGDFTP